MPTLVVAVLLAASAAAVSACSEQAPPGSPDLLTLSVFAAKSADSSDPYAGVAYIRIAVSDPNGTVLDKFVYYEPSGAQSVPEVPFGEDLQVTIEGWSSNLENGLIGDLKSRGRSSRFTVTPTSDPKQVNVVLARVNEFSLTTATGPTGTYPTKLSEGRIGHTVTALEDGRILIAGGAGMTPGKNTDFTSPGDLTKILDSVEIYDPETGDFSNMDGALANPRAFHTATLMPDGRVLIAGGLTDINGSRQALSTFQFFDPETSSFEPVGADEMSARAAHTAVVLDGHGHVMLAGGFSAGPSGPQHMASVEVYCPEGYGCKQSSGPIIYSTNMSVTRAFHTATKVPVGPDDKEAVLLCGGEGADGVRGSLETFWLAPAGFDLQVAEMKSGPRTRHTATWIASQRYLHVIGGFSDQAHTEPVQRIDSYQAAQRAFQPAEFYALAARGAHTAVPMPGNAILIAGGYDKTGPLDTAEVMFEYTNQEDGKTYIDRGGVKGMATPRGGLQGILLGNRTVLVVGGAAAGGSTVTMSEFFNPL